MPDPTLLPTCTVTVPHEPHTTLLAGGGELACFGRDITHRRCTLCGNFHCPGTPQLHPAKAGLTRAQEIRLAITLKAMELAEKTTGTEVEADDEDIADFVRVVTGVVAPLAAMVECGNAAACPDPSLHEEDDRAAATAGLLALTSQRDQAVIWVAELERQRDAVLALCDAMDRDLRNYIYPSDIRAIYAGHGDEERGDA